ncbi:ABC transporter permease [Ferrimonas kyonanensis]|uniref:ABC transporter permease n=1 Tax=Ferrimonas kyonanensis TaxID=364763 RepID=UPI00040DD2E0|nr:ABC transporter permease [Ferrimonas kyonanensis]
MSWWTLFRREWLGLLTDKAAMLTAIGGILFYAVIYPLPYDHQVAGAQPVAVVDLDQSATSRKLIRMWSASPKIHISDNYPEVDRAEQALHDGDIAALVVIPAQFERNLVRGQQQTLAVAGDGSFFLAYGNVATAMLQSSGYLNAEIRLARSVANGGRVEEVMRQLQPVSTRVQPVFNPNGSYISYVVPGALVLILHQTLLMVASMLGANNWHCRGEWHRYPLMTWVSARTTMLVCLYLPSCILYFDLVLPGHDVAMLASCWAMVQLLVPFLLSTALAGIAISTLFNRRAVPVQLLVLTGMPILFTCGFVWPGISMSPLLSGVFAWLPAQPAMMGMIKLNQMNLGIVNLYYELSTLWIQVIAWGILALLGTHWRQTHRASVLIDRAEPSFD